MAPDTAAITCKGCASDVDPLAVFPGPLCLECYKLHTRREPADHGRGTDAHVGWQGVTNDPFWSAVRQQLDELAHAKTATEVVAILSPERDPYHSVLGDDMRQFSGGFFAGSGGDDTVRAALREAGWTVIWSEASYYYAMRAPDGSAITYVEGDVYQRDTREDK